MTNRATYKLFIICIFLIATTLIVFSILPNTIDKRFNRVSNSLLPELKPKIKDFHQTLFVADLHADSLLWNRNLLKKNNFGHVDLPRLMEGNVALQGFGVVTKVSNNLNINNNNDNTDRITTLAIAFGWSPSTWNSLTQRAIYQGDKLQKFIAKSQGKLILIRDRKDLDRLVTQRQQGQKIIGALLGLEGIHAIEGNLNNFNLLYESGFRLIGLAHFFDNQAVGSAHGINKGGLTPFGHQLVQQIEIKKAIIDLAHVSPKAIDNILNIATKPVIVSHTGVRGTCNNQRNLTDKEIKGIAATKGVIGIAMFDKAVCGNTIKDTVRAIKYVANLVGVDYVALGSDFDGTVTTPIDISQMSLITQELFDNGFNESEISKIMGKNFLRVLYEIF